MRFLQKVRAIYWYTAGWFIVNLLFLTKFPFMHSDESWLSGLTRSMMGSGLDATETFFDLMPRYPHAIKTIYHLVQMLFINLFGYNLFAVRLISLIAGAASIILIYKIGCIFFKNKKTAFWAAVFLSVSIQFIYASHFARQETLILTGMLLVIYIMLKNTGEWTWKNDAVIAIATGIFIGVHPNSFLISLCAGAIYLYHMLTVDKNRWKNLILYILFTGIMAGIFIGISYIFDNDFITHYLKYGSELGVKNTVSLKTEGIVYYYKKLFLQNSVTYYTPHIRAELVIFAIAALGAGVLSYRKRKLLAALLPLLAVNAGFIIIGRFSQPGIILIFPFGVLLVFALLEQSPKTNITLASVLICAAMATNSVIGIAPYINQDYDDYLSGIAEYVPSESMVLANLNTEYAFDSGGLYDYRNLAYMHDLGLTFRGYVTERKIEYIIYPEEMDFIYERRPVWNVVYGNLYPYYEDMQEFLADECVLVHEFKSPYAMRIVQFANEKDWKVRIYKVGKDGQKN